MKLTKPVVPVVLVLGLLTACGGPARERASVFAGGAAPETVAGPGGAKSPPAPLPPLPVPPEDFVLAPWGVHSPDMIRDIRECGFNFAGFVNPEHLDAIHEYGLKAFVIHADTHASGDRLALPPEAIESRIRALLDKVGGHPANYGYYLRDEPPSRDYPALRLWVDAFRRADPKGVPYLNLFPNYVPLSIIESEGVESYEDYVEKFIEIVEPPFVSYDHYALMDDGTVRDGYFQNLETIRAIAHKHALPFWNIVLGNAHFHYADPTPGGLRFQAYTTLAYGARGLSYFKYYDSQKSNYRKAPIDQFGHKTPTWDMMRSVNLRLGKILPTYVTLESVHVFHHPNVPSGCQGIETSRWIETLEYGDFVVGEFVNPEGVPYVMIVNKDLHKSTPFAIQFKGDGTIMKISSFRGNAQRWGGENNWLSPGQGMLLYLDKPKGAGSSPAP